MGRHGPLPPTRPGTIRPLTSSSRSRRAANRTPRPPASPKPGPRGSTLSKEGETAIDVVAYAAQIACQLGAHVVKVKLPAAQIEQAAAKKVYDKERIPIATLAERVRHVVQSSFNGRRIVIFSGGEAKDTASILDEVRAIRDGGGFGSIIGRNSFQRPRKEAIELLQTVMDIYAGKAK